MLIDTPWGVSAFGAGSVRVAPDLARIRFTIVRVEPTPEKAFDVTHRAVELVREALHRYAVSDAAIQRSRVDLQSAWDGYGEKRNFLGYRCSAGFSVELADLDRLQPLLVALVKAGAHQVDGVEFDVRDKPALRAAARREAVLAARRKAELFAESAGVGLGPVLHVEDADPERLDREGYRGHGASADGASESLAPGLVVVAAAVVVGFAIAR